MAVGGRVVEHSPGVRRSRARFACPGRGCRDRLRAGPAFQASLNAGPSSPLADRLRLDVGSALGSIRGIGPCLGAVAAVGRGAKRREGGPNSLNPGIPWGRPPLQARLSQGGRQCEARRVLCEGRPLGVFHLCASVRICGRWSLVRGRDGDSDVWPSGGSCTPGLAHLSCCNPFLKMHLRQMVASASEIVRGVEPGLGGAVILVTTHLSEKC